MFCVWICSLWCPSEVRLIDSTNWRLSLSVWQSSALRAVNHENAFERFLIHATLKLITHRKNKNPRAINGKKGESAELKKDKTDWKWNQTSDCLNKTNSCASVFIFTDNERSGELREISAASTRRWGKMFARVPRKLMKLKRLRRRLSFNDDEFWVQVEVQWLKWIERVCE